MSGPEQLQLTDRRWIDIRVSGPVDGLPLVFHHGTPGARIPFRVVERAAHARGWRFVTTSRPGYGDSTRQCVCPSPTWWPTRRPWSRRSAPRAAW